MILPGVNIAIFQNKRLLLTLRDRSEVKKTGSRPI